MVGESELDKLELRPGDIALSVDQLRLTPLFADVSGPAARRLGSLRGRGAVVLRHYRAGEVVCRQGEPGWTAFYILRDADLRRLGLPVAGASLRADAEDSGAPSVSIDRLLLSDAQSNRVKAQVSIAPARSVRAPLPETGLLRRAGERLFRLKRGKRTIPVDASADVVLTGDGPMVGHLREGELFGEMSCFNHTPRSATVRTTEDCYLLELMRNVLEDALHNEAFREALSQIYRKRALETHLATAPIFEKASPEALDLLRRRADLVSYDTGAAIFREGDVADAMYFIRHGTVKLFREKGNGRVIGYRSRGSWIGVSSLLSGDRRATSCEAYQLGPKDSDRPVRSAIGHRVELVRIGRELFEEVCEMFPDLRDAAIRMADLHSKRSLEPHTAIGVENLAGSLGFSQGEKLMLIDLNRCTRCDDCVRACADTHDGVSHVTRSGPRFGPYLVPDTCRQCLDPVCLLGCPVGSIHRGAGGEIVIEDWCIGCGLCAEQCPYDAIKLGEGAARKAQVCDQCASLGGGPPMCVYACPHDAAHRVDGRSFFADWVRRS